MVTAVSEEIVPRSPADSGKRIHTVQQGECLSSLAARYGLAGWEQLYNYDANAALKKKRPNPNILAPGDTVVLPDITQKWVPAATNRLHTFKVKIHKVKLRIAIIDRKEKPYPGKRFAVNAGESEIRGKTTSAGIVEALVPETEPTARLRVWLFEQDDDALPTIDRELAIGHINPIEMKSGIRGRLSNLGYNCPIADENEDEVDDQLLAAARAFRARNKLPEVEPPKENEDGTVDDAALADYADRLLDGDFKKKLQAVYESKGEK